MFKCIENFTVPRVDGDGFETSKDFHVKRGTIWNLPEDENYRLVGGDVRLENDDMGWIEISDYRFQNHFIAFNKNPLAEV